MNRQPHTLASNIAWKEPYHRPQCQHYIRQSHSLRHQECLFINRSSGQKQRTREIGIFCLEFHCLGRSNSAPSFPSATSLLSFCFTLILSSILPAEMATPTSLSLFLLAMSSLVSASQGLVTTPHWRRGTPSTGYYDPNANGGSMLTVSFMFIIPYISARHTDSLSSKSMGHSPQAKESLSMLSCPPPQIATFWWIQRLMEG